MRLFEFETSLSFDEIQNQAACYYEFEQHSPWDIFTEYNSPRKGLHLYFTDDGFKGYYEDGTYNRYQMLQRAKVWVKVKIKEKNGKRIVRGYTYFCPTLTLALLIGFGQILFDEDILAFIFIGIICTVLLVSSLKEENEIIECVKKLLCQ